MKITILGSAAAEAIPNPYCQCSVCCTARQEGGRNVRARSAAIINDDLSSIEFADGTLPYVPTLLNSS